MSEAKEKPKDYIDLCVGCNQGITREEMVYKKGKPFHSECFEKNGNSFQNMVPELIQESSNTKVQLVYLKNLKNRQVGGVIRRSTSKKPKSKTKSKKSRKKKLKKKPKRRPVRIKKAKKKGKSRSRRSAFKSRRVKKHSAKKRSIKRRTKHKGRKARRRR